MLKFPLKKEKAGLLCLGENEEAQKLEKMTSSTVEPIKTHRANPNKTVDTRPIRVNSFKKGLKWAIWPVFI